MSASIVQTKVRPISFWSEQTVKGTDAEYVKLDISYNDFLLFLQANGFGLLVTGDEQKVAEVVRVVKNIVSRTVEHRNTNITVKHFVLDYLREIDRMDVREVMLRRQSTFFTMNFLTALRPVHIHFAKDSRTRSRFYFANGLIEMQWSETDGVKTMTTEFLKYDDLGLSLWETQIQPRDYAGYYHPEYQGLWELQPCEFHRFLEYVSQETTGGGDSFEILRNNLAAFRYGLAYLLHSYKDVARAFAVLCVDADGSTESSNGRRGKSLFTKAIEFLRRVVYEDGKTMKTDNQFLFQNLDADSQVALFDDVRKNFDFEQFYPTITGHCMTERKGRSRVKLDFSDAPKFVFTSNKPVLGEGDSDQARWLILPFTNFFNKAHTPFDVFGHRLFEDWDATEWARFFDYLIDLMREYLAFINCPLFARPEPDLTTYNEEKLKWAVASELVDYFDTYLAALPYNVSKKLFFDDFKGLYPLYSTRTQHWFSCRLHLYCAMRGMVINAGMPDGRAFKVHEATGIREEWLYFTKGGDSA